MTSAITTAASAFVAFGAIRWAQGVIADLGRVQQLTAQTNAVIKATGGVANVSGGDVAGLADRFEKLTGVEAETVQESANFLLTFKNVRNEVGEGNDIFNQATLAVQDLAVSGFGDAKTASIQLGKALNDPIAGITALGRSGITFSEQQKETIRSLVETGDVLGAQKIILAEVQSQVGGAAEAYGETLPGKLAKARNAIGNASESLLATFVPAIEAGAGAAAKLGEFVTALPGPAQTATTVLLGLGGAGLLLAPRIGAAIDVVSRLTERLNAGGPAAQRMGGALTGLGRAAGVAAGVGTAAVVIDQLVDALNPGPPIEQLTKGLIDFTDVGKASGVAAELFGANLERLPAVLADIDFSGPLTGLLGLEFTLPEAAKKVAGLDATLADFVSRGNLERATQLLEEAKASLSTEEYEKLTANLPKYDEALAATANQQALTADSASALGAETGAMAAEVEEAAAAFDEAVASIRTLHGELTAGLETEITYQAAIDRLTEAVAKNGSTIDLNTEQGRANAEAALSTGEAIVGLAQQYLSQGVSVDEATARTNGNIAALQRQLEQAGFTKEEVRRLIEQMGLTPENVSTFFETPGLRPAINDTNSLVGALNRLGSPPPINIRVNTAEAQAAIDRFFGRNNGRQLVADLEADVSGVIANRFPRRQHGGPVQAGRGYIVGERRAELFVPEVNGQIHASVPAGRSAPVVHNHYHFHQPVIGGQAGARDFVRMVDDVSRGRRRMSGT
jgi:hypothetical protein